MANGMDERREKDANTFANMMAMMRQAQGMDDTTMLGFGLGKLLRGAWDHYWDAKELDKQNGYNPTKDKTTAEGFTSNPYQTTAMASAYKNTPQQQMAINMLMGSKDGTMADIPNIKPTDALLDTSAWNKYADLTNADSVPDWNRTYRGIYGLGGF